MGDLIQILQKRQFTLEQARGLLPVVRRITQRAISTIKNQTTQLSYFKDAEKKNLVESQIQTTLQSWRQSLNKLGLETKGLWLVDFDNGEGYYCWHYPESEISHFHGYLEGFQGRVKIS